MKRLNVDYSAGGLGKDYMGVNTLMQTKGVALLMSIVLLRIDSNGTQSIRRKDNL